VNSDQAALIRDLLVRAREAQRDASILTPGCERGAALRAAEAILLAARALLVRTGLDRADWAAVTLLFDRHLVATELVSKACGEALHKALRARREADEGDLPVFYPARVQALRDAAAAILAEAEIVLESPLSEAGATARSRNGAEAEAEPDEAEI
jgi:uncharacterized protein (UPF0332 family)